jgi:hypothetical protein
VSKLALHLAQAKTFLRGQRKPQVPVETIYKAHKALKQRRSIRGARSRQYVSHHSQDMAKPQIIVSTAISPKARKITSKVTPSIQQVWVPSQKNPKLKPNPAR